MDFDALKLPIDPMMKAQSIQQILDKSHDIKVVKPLKLNLMDVILNQAKYLNHFSYLIYLLALVILMLMVRSSNYVEMMVYLGIVAVIFPLLTTLECNDATRHGLSHLQKTYPFNSGLIMALRFVYLTLLNTVVLTIYILVVNTINRDGLIDIVSALSLIASLLVYSGSSLCIGLTIKKTRYAVLINGLVNGIMQLMVIPLVTMVITTPWFYQIMWLVMIMTIAIMVFTIAFNRLNQKGNLNGYIGH